MALKSLQDLFVEELKDLYSAEKQLVKALPEMAKAASAPELRAAFEEHLAVTRGQVVRLDQVFEELGIVRKAKKCRAMEGLIEEGEELMKEDMRPAILDAALIVAAQKVEHYEIAGYGSARTFARLLGATRAAELLQLTLDEEGEADKKLTGLACALVNLQASEESTNGEDKPKKRAPRRKAPARAAGGSPRRSPPQAAAEAARPRQRNGAAGER